MNIFNLLLILWSVFILYWIISAIGVKKNIRTKDWQRGVGIRILSIIVVIRNTAQKQKH
jgi:hypothetical protein